MTAETAEPAVVHLDADQIVAMNLRYWRRMSGMTQEELGDLLGWSAANVSAAERSADEKRERRRFDASTLAALSLALRIPLIALFLPPDDEGAGKRYLLPALPGDPDGDTELSMKELLAFVVLPDTAETGDVMADYRYRLTNAADRLLDPGWAKEVARILRPVESAEMRARRAERLRLRRDDLLKAAAEYGDLADAIDPEGDADDR
jgi:transcriptional regulator with XRE-family HTH domain